MEIINTEQYNKVKSDMKVKMTEAWKTLNSVRAEESKLIKDLINLKGKYLKIKDYEDEIKYLYVTEQFDADNIVFIKGLGFKKDILDNTCFTWDTSMGHTIRIDCGFEKDIENISEITEYEFNKAFKDMIAEITKKQYSFHVEDE